MGIRVLTVEDSTLIRLIINNTIKDMDGVELVGTAENGKVALDLIKELKPDVITLDLVMPVMNGLETLTKIRELSDVPIIILSAQSDIRTTIEALENGAQDFLTKPESITRNRKEFREDLHARFIALVNNSKLKSNHTQKKNKQTNKTAKKSEKLGNKNVEALLIGASTGGPKMLTSLISSLKSNLSIPIFIVQHMPAGFTASFAKRLDSLAAVSVVEAEHNMPVKNGTVYLAPGGYHMVLKDNYIKLLDNEKINSVKPAIDPMFSSAIEQYGGNLLAVILTGMGRDGAQGCVEVKEAGGFVIAQDEETSVVYGMPKSAFETGAVDLVLSIDEIVKEINEQIEGQ